MREGIVVEDVQMLGGFQQALLWLAALGVVLVCAAILVVTIRHRLLRTVSDDGQKTSGGTDGRASASGRAGLQPLLAETFWVLVPMAMVLGLGAWVVAGYVGYPL